MQLIPSQSNAAQAAAPAMVRGLSAAKGLGKVEQSPDPPDGRARRLESVSPSKMRVRTLGDDGVTPHHAPSSSGSTTSYEGDGDSINFAARPAQSWECCAAQPDAKDFWRKRDKMPEVYLPRLPAPVVVQRLRTSKQVAALERPSFEEKLGWRHEQREREIQQLIEQDKADAVVARREHVNAIYRLEHEHLVVQQKRRVAREDAIPMEHYPRVPYTGPRARHYGPRVHGPHEPSEIGLYGGQQVAFHPPAEGFRLARVGPVRSALK